MKELLEKCSFVDVRSPGEYVQGHYPGAINIPLDELGNRLPELKQLQQPLVAYCRSGNRSAMAVSILRENGFTEVFNGGGLDDLLQMK